MITFTLPAALISIVAIAIIIGVGPFFQIFFRTRSTHWLLPDLQNRTALRNPCLARVRGFVGSREHADTRTANSRARSVA
ncbi:MAG: hypothetical protein NVS4B2_16660 [Chloroflexota bacterium]